MKLLALETTRSDGSVAALIDGNPLRELRLDPNQRSAQSLLPTVRRLMDEIDWKPHEVQLIAVIRGPGSFTGLRVGVTAAKTFAYVVGADLVAVDTLETLATAVPDHVEVVSAAVDAQRGQVVAAMFRRKPLSEGGGMIQDDPAERIDRDTWLDGLPEGTVVVSPMLDRLTEPLPPHLVAMDRQWWYPTAVQAGRLAWQRYQAGQRDDLWQLVPDYSRPSAAEEKHRKY